MVEFNNLLEIAAQCYGFDRADCRFMVAGREESKELYTFQLGGRPYILRLVRGSMEEVGQVEAEMDWLCYLAEQGVSVPCPLRTKDEELAIPVEKDGVTYILSAFSKAEGRSWDKNDPNLWNADVFYNWGKAVGAMHQATKDYRPASEQNRRGEFDIRGIIGRGIKAFPTVRRIAEELLREIEALPRDRDAYGLIHNDLHPNNFFIDGERISFFDFDGCAYSWYVFDVGNALYLALWLGRENDRGEKFTEDIIRYFLRGYLLANPTSDFWLSKIPRFMMLCKIALFSVGCDCENPENGLNTPYQAERVRNIENGTLFTGCIVEDSLFKNG